MMISLHIVSTFILCRHYVFLMFLLFRPLLYLLYYIHDLRTLYAAILMILSNKEIVADSEAYGVIEL